MVFNQYKYKTLKLMNEKGEFTNVGLLLSDQNPVEVKFACTQALPKIRQRKRFCRL